MTEPGVITLKGDETAVISNVQAGSAYTVKEILEEGSGYDATYEVIIDNAAFISAEDANGTVSAGKDNKIQITNTEKGAELVLPVSKVIGDPNCAQNFTLRMVETDANWEAKEQVQTEFSRKLRQSVLKIHSYTRSLFPKK
ncbi:MAG: hypothetical protein J6M22_03535 [Firmicutes bacterium]|nr:hypothetical protein [Bacillota bacterium]